MKTLYYKIEIREPGIFFNNGFVKVEIGDERKINLFGILTGDVIIGEEQDKKIKFSYFVRNYIKNCFEENFTVLMDLEEFKLPERFTFEDEDGKQLIIVIGSQIKSELEKKKYDSRIAEIIDVFEDES